MAQLRLPLGVGYSCDSGWANVLLHLNSRGRRTHNPLIDQFQNQLYTKNAKLLSYTNIQKKTFLLFLHSNKAIQ